MFLGRTKNDGSPGPDRVFLEDDEENVVRSLEEGDPIEYFFIRISTPATTLQVVTLNPAPRNPGGNTEIAEIIAGGSIVGQARVDQ